MSRIFAKITICFALAMVTIKFAMDDGVPTALIVALFFGGWLCQDAFKDFILDQKRRIAMRDVVNVASVRHTDEEESKFQHWIDDHRDLLSEYQGQWIAVDPVDGAVVANALDIARFHADLVEWALLARRMPWTTFVHAPAEEGRA